MMNKTEWWRKSVVYQIYPKSFNDSNGDGIGDIRGIIEKLDYLKQLGVDVIWLNPIYQSPQVDNGYDISNYREIDHQFGTLADFTALLDAVHQRHMRLILDLVVNHTSSEHPWFKAAKQSTSIMIITFGKMGVKNSCLTTGVPHLADQLGNMLINSVNTIYICLQSNSLI